MQYILNTSSPGYTNACIFPVSQQIAGGFTVIKDTIGLIKDLAIMILFCSSQETVNAYCDKQMEIANRILDDLEKVENAIERAQGAAFAFLSQEGKQEFFDKEEANFEEFRRIYDLHLYPLTRLQEAGCMGGDPGSYSKFLGDATRIIYQLQNKKETPCKLYLFFLMCKGNPPLERIQNIAIGLISATPVVGTVYNLASRYYIKNYMEESAV